MDLVTKVDKWSENLTSLLLTRFTARLVLTSGKLIHSIDQF